MERRHLAQVGAAFRSSINDLTRDDVTAARDLGVELTDPREILNGERARRRGRRPSEVRCGRWGVRRTEKVG